MPVERLHFGPGEMPYHAMHVADHLTRYLMLRAVCRGKSVLDVACGEGYGSALLAEWGAARVVGVDSSVEAIARAKKLFLRPNVSYLVGDACSLDPKDFGREQFDIICSFETIEHVDDSEAFLSAIAKLRAQQGLVVISAPNDDIASIEDNPFHKRRYTLETLKEQAEAALGEATTWLLGVPSQGYMLLPESAGLRTPESADMSIALSGRDAGALHLIPPQANLSVTPENAAYWLGVWGQLENFPAVASPLSMAGFLEPWKALDADKRKIEAIERESESKGAEIRRLNIVLSEAETVKRKMQAIGRECDLKEAEIRRLNIVLAEERRTALSDMQRISDLAQGLNSLERQSFEQERRFEEVARSVSAIKFRLEHGVWGLPDRIGRSLKKRAKAVKGYLGRRNP
jgi:SAM-dependent methyltransferase